jgi:hypothetical protein
VATEKSSGLIGRLVSSLGRALERGILGRSTHEYRKKFTGNDEFWQGVLAAQAGWQQNQPRGPDPRRFRRPADFEVEPARVAVRARR